MTIFHKLAYYPTIGYGILLEYLGLRTRYTRIDSHCILGALPFKNDCENLVKNENIKAVLTLNEPHELSLSLSQVDWEKLGCDYMRISIKDYYGVATTEQIHEAVSYINKHKELNNCVLVHCKAGRYRSALIVACYVANNNRHLSIQQIIKFIEKLRPSVILNRKRQIDAIDKYKSYIETTKITAKN